jgi:hypothetical protein
MILSTHIVVGTAVASLFPNQPLIGFSAAFTSHFLLDAIPHWDYELSSKKTNWDNRMEDDFNLDRRFVNDLRKILTDIVAGALLATAGLAVSGHWSLTVLAAGIFGGILPDALQVVYVKFRHQPLTSLYRFHMWIQEGKQLKVGPLNGLLLQWAIAVPIVLLSLLVF